MNGERTVTITLTEEEAGNLRFLLHMARGMRRDVGNDKGAEEVAVLQAKLRAALKTGRRPLPPLANAGSAGHDDTAADLQRQSAPEPTNQGEAG